MKKAKRYMVALYEIRDNGTPNPQVDETYSFATPEPKLNEPIFNDTNIAYVRYVVDEEMGLVLAKNVSEGLVPMTVVTCAMAMLEKGFAIAAKNRQ